MSSRQHIHKPRHLGDKIADAVTGSMGSWRFIIIQSVIVTAWIAFNLWLLSRPFDAYPFILLNLVFSTQAAYASPLILMSQNRQADRDRKRDDIEADEVAQIFSSHQLLLKINEQQIDILNQQTEMLELLKRPQQTSKLKAVRVVRNAEVDE